MNNTAEVIQAKETNIAEFSEFESSLAEFKQRYEGAVYDLSDPAQEKQARSDKHAIGKVVSKLDATHKTAKAPLKEKVDLLDGERKRIKDQLLSIQDGIKNQIATREAEIEARHEELNAKVEAISALSIFEGLYPDSALIGERLEAAKAAAINESFDEYEADAALAKSKAIESLENLLAETKAREEEQKELARLRAEEEARKIKEREEQIAREATEAAEKEAAAKIEKERIAKEAAEQATKDAAEKAERDKAEAAERAEREQQEAVARVQEEAKREAERVEQERLASIEKERIAAETREANKKHCERINNAAVSALIDQCDISDDLAKDVITLIAKGSVPAVSIKY